MRPSEAASGRWTFVLPKWSDRPSGGNVYNESLLEALSRFAGVATLAADGFRNAVLQGAPGNYLVDTLDLDASDVIESRAPGQRFVLVVHFLPSLDPDRTPSDVDLLRERSALRRFDAFVVTSAFTRAHLERLGLPPERIVIVRPATEAAPGPFVPLTLPIRSLVVGNLIALKGIAELLGCLDARTRPGDAYALDVFGRSDIDPAHALACTDLVARSAALAARVTFRGAVPHADLARELDRAHVFVSASRMETFGLALAEARARGVFALAVDGGNAAEHVAGGAGLLFPTVPALADGLLELVRDPGRLDALRRQARAAPRLVGTWDDAARMLAAELERVLGAIAP